jgi:hypothetical protein
LASDLIAQTPTSADSYGGFGLPGWIALGVSLFANCILIFYQFVKLGPEIRNLKLDAESKSAATLKLMQESRDAYDDSSEALGEKAAALLGAIRENADVGRLHQLREELCKAYAFAIRQHKKSIEFVGIYYQHQLPNLRRFLTRDLTDDLNRFAFWQAAINKPTLIEKIGGCNPFWLSRRTISPWLHMCEQLADSSEQRRTHEELWDCIQPMVDPDEIDRIGKAV